MVALAIGMLASIVILQMFALSEERSRTATNGGDAQSNGVLTFYQLQSNIARSGYGINALGLFNCSTTWRVASGSNLAKSLRLAPATINPVDATGAAIIPAGDPNTDTLLLMYGNSDGQPEGTKVDTMSSPSYTMVPSSFAVGDRVIAVPIMPTAVAGCSADLIVDRITAVAATTVTVATGASGTSLFNLGRGPNGSATAGAQNGPTVLAYAIRNGNLTACDFMVNDCSIAANTGDSTVWEPLASNIISLRAEYGRDTSTTMDGFVDSYDQTTPATACDWARVSALRVSLVARSAQFEKTTVTAAAPVWDGTADVAIDLSKNPNGSANPNWQNYRYKLFQGVIPLRNITAMGALLVC